MRSCRLPWLLAVLALLLTPARAEILIVNGDFELPFEPEWVPTASGGGATIDRATVYDPDPDYEARVLLVVTGFGRLRQMVWAPDTQVQVSARVRVLAEASTSDVWAAAALVFEYYDAAQELLGETRLGTWTHECPWVESSSVNLLALPNNMWFDLFLDLNEEVVALPAVDPADVQYIGVALYTNAAEC